MHYHDIRPAVFQARPNRFVAQVTLPDGTPVRAHVKNTGRCAELLVPGAKVYLEYAANPRRATPCDLVAVEKPTPRGTLLVNMDSAAPNAAAGEWLAAGGLGPLQDLRAEQTLAIPALTLPPARGTVRCWWRSRAARWKPAAWPVSPTRPRCGD